MSERIKDPNQLDSDIQGMIFASAFSRLVYLQRNFYNHWFQLSSEERKKINEARYAASIKKGKGFPKKLTPNEENRLYQSNPLTKDKPIAEFKREFTKNPLYSWLYATKYFSISKAGIYYPIHDVGFYSDADNKIREQEHIAGMGIVIRLPKGFINGLKERLVTLIAFENGNSEQIVRQWPIDYRKEYFMSLSTILALDIRNIVDANCLFNLDESVGFQPQPVDRVMSEFQGPTWKKYPRNVGVVDLPVLKNCMFCSVVFNPLEKPCYQYLPPLITLKKGDNVGSYMTYKDGRCLIKT